MHSLRKGLIGSREENQDLCIGVKKILLRKPPNGTILVDWMDDRPTECEENNALTIQIKVVKLPYADPVDQLELRENNLDLNIDKLTGSPICNSELESGRLAIGSDNRVTAINNSRRRPGESAENHSCCERYPENVDQRLDRHKSVGGDSKRNDVPVSDCRERVDAEEERPIKRVACEAPRRGLKRVRAAQQERKREECVDCDVRCCDEAE